MTPLEKQLRSKLENTIKDARDIAEAGALAALQQLGVGLKEADAHLSEAEKDLRRRLRAHGRQLGDLRQTEGTQELSRLTEEIAYEHWHRMLFARFLAENNLLMYPDPDGPVAVSLEECEEMAADEGARNGWELAARYASKMLPQIFRPDSPSFELELPPEYQRKLENRLAGLAVEVFQASDALGWVYQFWQAKRKQEVNDSEVKIGARELPAVTQLFTEPYMVSFLLDNSLGAWWAGKVAGVRRQESGGQAKEARRLLVEASSEEELRDFFSLPGVPLEYLRFVKIDVTVESPAPSYLPAETSSYWTPAAGTFDGWPDDLSELKTLDPCCGSGHFLVAAFLMLVPMRMELEGLSARKAVDAVLRENLHGLELDARCVELAAFALALTAWRYPEASGYRELPELQLACSGLSISVAKEEWKQLAELAADASEGRQQADLFGDEESGLWKTRLTGAMDRMYRLFLDAPVLGSLIDPNILDRELFQADFSESKSLFGEIADTARTSEQKEMGVVAQGLAKAAFLLSSKFHLVITNVPYLGRGKQDDAMIDHGEIYFPSSKQDLATMFIERIAGIVAEGGASCIVGPQNWSFLKTYKSMRENLLTSQSLCLLAELGAGAFQTPLYDFSFLLYVAERKSDSGRSYSTVLASEMRSIQDKMRLLKEGKVNRVEQSSVLSQPDRRVLTQPLGKGKPLSNYCHFGCGLQTGDNDRFIRKVWESDQFGLRWSFFQRTADKHCFHGGLEQILDWSCGSGPIKDHQGFRDNGTASLLSKIQRNGWAFVVHRMGRLPISIAVGELFDQNGAVLIPSKDFYVLPIRCFLESNEYHDAVRKLDNKVGVTPATLVKVPFELEHWTKVAAEKYPHGLPQPYSDDPTQWIFHGHPFGSVQWSVDSCQLEEGPARTDDSVLQVAVARLLGYRWPAELDLSMELAAPQRAWAERCEPLLPFADKDGIVCIPAVRGEASAADRLLNLLATAYGDAWSNATTGHLLAAADQKDKSLEGWLRDKFFIQHCKRFAHRPFIWHIWDGLRDGFAALVNYHKFDAKALETLIYTYLGDWISRQQQDIRNGVDGAEEKLAAAETLKQRLELIQQGEKPYDIFVRWKPLAEQPIGWNPDLNDGVRLNIRPFMTGPDLKKAGAGILRDKPNIHWNKDRGKDVESAPWYPLFKGERINDHHLSREKKEAARKD